MNLQYISDHQGKLAGVFIPIEEWLELKKKYDLPGQETAKAEIISDIKEALNDVKLHRQGKIQLPTMRDFLDSI